MKITDHPLIVLIVTCAAVAATTWSVSQNLIVGPLKSTNDMAKERIKELDKELAEYKKGKHTPTLHKWNYRHFRNTETKQLVDWINGLNSGFGDIESAIAGNDIHVWARKGDTKGGYWSITYEEWDNQSQDNAKFALDGEAIIVLGMSGSNFHFLRWKQ